MKKVGKVMGIEHPKYSIYIFRNNITERLSHAKPRHIFNVKLL